MLMFGQKGIFNQTEQNHDIINDGVGLFWLQLQVPNIVCLF